MGRAYKDDAQFHNMKLDLKTNQSSTLESWSDGVARQKQEQAERSTSGSTVQIFKQRISTHLCKILDADIRSNQVNSLIDRHPDQIQKMFDVKIAPEVAAKKLIEIFEDGPVGFTFYVSRPELLLK